jgi:ribonuclease HII
VVLRPDWDNPAVDDSKRLSPGERDRLYGLIAREAAAFSVAVLENSEVDCLNPLGASMKAMREALLGLPEAPALALVDGDRLPDLPCRARAVVKGDSLSLSIAAASIVAKVTRDRLMLELHAKFPGYGFDRHKGYGTAAHLAALRELGPSPVHRLSFRGVLQGPGAPSPKGGGHGGPGGPGPGPGGPPGGLGLGG